MKVRLEVKAPIRVGGREQTINKLEFVLLRKRLHAVSPRRLAKLLFEHEQRALGDWNTEVLRRGSDADLTTFLRKKNLLDESVERISRFSARCDHSNPNQFQPHARDAFGKLFIPGSAIKGAIRTAVMYALVDEDRAKGYMQRNRSNKTRFFAGNLEREVLQSYELPDRNLKPGPHFDLLRAVKIFDAYGDGELDSSVEKITIQSYTEDRRGRTASVRDNNKPVA